MFLIMYVNSIYMVSILHCFLLFLTDFNWSIVLNVSTNTNHSYSLTQTFVAIVRETCASVKRPLRTQSSCTVLPMYERCVNRVPFVVRDWRYSCGWCATGATAIDVACRPPSLALDNQSNKSISFNVGMCGMDFSSSVRFWEKPWVRFGFLCRLVVIYKNV